MSIASAVFLMGYLRKKYDLATLTGINALLSLVLIGFISSHYNDDLNAPHHIVKQSSTNSYFKATVIQEDVRKKNSYQSIVYLNTYLDSTGWKNCVGKVILYHAHDSSNTLLREGDRLLFKGRVQPIENRGNPYEFDYKAFIARKNIFHQAFIGGNYKVIDHKEHFLSKYIYSIRNHYLRVFESHFKNPDQRSVLSALILGQKNDLSRDLKSNYARSGAMHILAVSGLHVGIIYLIIVSFLKMIGLSRKKSILKATIVILCIWIYAAVTDFSPSVTRASIMFSFIVIAENTIRKSNIYNTLCATAFLMLLFNPNKLYEVGFQLSFVAVFGIIYFFKRVYDLIYIENKVIDWFWQISCVTIAVQLATFPISLFYFHQFPLQGILTNIIAIPSAFGLLSGGLLLGVLDPIQMVSNYLGKALGYIVDLLNSAVIFSGKLDFLNILNFNFGLFELALIYAIIILLIVAFETQSKIAIYLTMLLIFTFGVNQNLQKEPDRQLIIYNAPGKSLVDFISGRRIKTLGSQENENTKYITNPLRERFLNPKTSAGLNLHRDSLNNARAFYFGTKRVFILEKGWIESNEVTNTMKTDFLIIKSESINTPSDLNSFEADQIIFDSSWRPYQLTDFKALKNAHFVTLDGAFRASF